MQTLLMMKNVSIKIFALFALLIMLWPSAIYGQRGQELSTTNTRARRAFEEAIQFYQLRNFRAAEASFRQAVQHDPRFIEAYIILGEMLQQQQKHDDAIDAYSRAIGISRDFFPNNHFYLGHSLLSVGRYEEARKALLDYLSFPNISEEMRRQTHHKLRNCDFAMQAIQNPVPFDPHNLGDGVNSPHDEYAPALTADEQTLIFTRKQPRTDPEFMQFGSEYEDFYVSQRQNGQWGPAVNLGPPINTPRNEGAQSLSADGMHLYFTACNRPGGYGSCDIYYARRQGDNWSDPVNLGPVINSSAWDSQPSISPDGRSLYFVSARRGNFGHMDIWVSYRIEGGEWQAPENLGPVINTSGREMSPFIHPDNRTLFFASDGHIGMGGMDLFYTRKDETGNWQTPVNLGYPINTFAEEISLMVGASGREAYFASEKPGGYGGSDLYFFELYEDARPDPVTYMKGVVFDAISGRKLGASFELIDLQANEIVVQSHSDAMTGSFLVPIPLGRNMALNVSRAGYLFFSQNFSFEDMRGGGEPHLFDVPLQPIREGETVVLRNIFFETGSAALRPESLSELQRLYQLLQQNPGMQIEISGHTDNVGSFAMNKELSEARARSVYHYLLERGVEARRLRYSGYADSRPVATNDTPEGRAQNRRTEFKVMAP